MTEVEFKPEDTVKDLFDELLADHIKKVKEKLDTLQERKKADIRTKDLLDCFKSIWGDVDYFMMHLSIGMCRYLIFDNIRSLQHEFESALRACDEIKALYLLNRIANTLGWIVNRIENGYEYEEGYKGPKIFIACCREEPNKLYQDHSHMFPDMEERARVGKIRDEARKAMGL